MQLQEGEDLGVGIIGDVDVVAASTGGAGKFPVLYPPGVENVGGGAGLSGMVVEMDASRGISVGVNEGRRRCYADDELLSSNDR